MVSSRDENPWLRSGSGSGSGSESNGNGDETGAPDLEEQDARCCGFAPELLAGKYDSKTKNFFVYAEATK